MPLHPQAQAMIDGFPAAATLDFSSLSIQQFRAAFDVPAPAKLPHPSVRIEEKRIPGPVQDQLMRLRIYRPQVKEPLPMTLFFHGGGFVIGGPEMTDGICETLAHTAHTLVLSLDYRLAPEAPHPAAIDDAMCALHWVHAHATELGALPNRLAVAGDSSGGHLAATVAQLSCRSSITLCHQLLMYPVLDASCNTDSYGRYANGYFLSAAMMRWFWRQYLGHPDRADDASPARQSDLQGLPGTTLVTAEYDVLCDEALAYGQALQAAGVAVQVQHWPGQIHGFLLMQGLIDDADAALVKAGKALGKALRKSFASA